MSCLSISGSLVRGEAEEVVERLLRPGRIIRVEREKYRFRQSGGPHIYPPFEEMETGPDFSGDPITWAKQMNVKYWMLLGRWERRRRFMVRMMGDGCTVEVEAPAELAEPWYGRGGGVFGGSVTGIIPAGLVRMPAWPHLGQGAIQSASVSVRDGRCMSVNVTMKGYFFNWTPAKLWPELVAAIVAVQLGGLQR